MKLNYIDIAIIVFYAVVVVCVLYVLFQAILFIHETKLMWY